MPSCAGASPAISTTVRHAEKVAHTEVQDHALIRRAVTAICALADHSGKPMRRSVAREYVLARAAGGDDHDTILRGARDELGLYVDETGATAVRNVDRGRSR